MGKKENRRIPTFAAKLRDADKSLWDWLQPLQVLAFGEGNSRWLVLALEKCKPLPEAIRHNFKYSPTHPSPPYPVLRDSLKQQGVWNLQQLKFPGWISRVAWNNHDLGSKSKSKVIEWEQATWQIVTSNANCYSTQNAISNWIVMSPKDISGIYNFIEPKSATMCYPSHACHFYKAQITNNSVFTQF